MFEAQPNKKNVGKPLKILCKMQAKNNAERITLRRMKAQRPFIDHCFISILFPLLAG